MSQDIRNKNFNAQKPPEPFLGPIYSGSRTFWDLKKCFWVFLQLNFGVRGHQCCQNGLFCIILIFCFPELQITFFYGPDGSGWVHMKGNGPLSVSEVQERPDMVKYAHSTVSEKPTLKGGQVSLRSNIKNEVSKNFAQTNFFQDSIYISLGKYAFLHG